LPYSYDFERALQHAAQLHRRQHRKGSDVPYVTHLLGVAAIAGEYGGTEEEVIGALLHDALEDTPVTTEDLQGWYGDEIAKIVEGCSDTDVIPKPPWLERKKAYVEHIGNAPRSVRLVSAADKLHNARMVLKDLRAEGEAVWERFTGGKQGTVWYYRAMVDALRPARDMVYLVEELERVVEEIEDLSAR
jgi:(p)ppGpp synthase/HD superfamily hydrolase